MDLHSEGNVDDSASGGVGMKVKTKIRAGIRETALPEFGDQ